MKASPRACPIQPHGTGPQIPGDRNPQHNSRRIRRNEHLEASLRILAGLPPLVTPWEIEALKSDLAEVAAGRKFLLQGGDCAESFDDCNAPAIVNRIKVLLQMSLVLVHGSEKPVVRVGRFAGQYAKPRSSDNETREGMTLPAYRGDLVNRKAFNEASRIPDPDLMLRAYERAALTLNYTRALVRGGLADLHHPENWNIGFIQKAELATEYAQILDSVSHALRFMENVLGVRAEAMRHVDLFTSHEALHLPYEEAITRREGESWYNVSTHFPWIRRSHDAHGRSARRILQRYRKPDCNESRRVHRP